MRSGEKIKRARERAVLTQGELARAAGITQNALSQIETGRRIPRVSTLRALAKVLGMQPADLLPD